MSRMLVQSQELFLWAAMPTMPNGVKAVATRPHHLKTTTATAYIPHVPKPERQFKVGDPSHSDLCGLGLNVSGLIVRLV